MDWQTYKALCDRPDHWTRWMLEQCIDLLGQLERAELSSLLLNAVAQTPIDVPADHKGPAATHVIPLALTPVQRADILQAVMDAERLGLRTPQTAGRGLGGFIEAWREYVDFEFDGA